MLVLHRSEQRWEDRYFRELPEFLSEGDCLVLNDSRVLASRLFGQSGGTGRAVQVMLIEPVSPDGREWRALVRPGKKLPVGEVVRFDERFSAEIIARGERGERTVRFLGPEDVYSGIDRLGHMPLPPYIKRQDNPTDRDRYQTVFARERGSVAAPTAGLHFTGDLLGKINHVGVTLHVGLGTFQPIEREDFENHQLHFERYSIPEESWREIESAKRVLAVGTTCVRTIESAAATGHLSGATNLFIYPGYEFRKVGAMLTNFHLPRTSLLLLVCALAGKDLMLAAYNHAVKSEYRFFSYGDCMLIL
ncbi:MAG: S-adenosylmethionine:tRNA ribosyltransferase-isomerase [Bryobacterales bacterium]|nr:S-adenosylmethionine:tRNA ribosyltransferase-isomerase [Bryobacterales bacterium]